MKKWGIMKLDFDKYAAHLNAFDLSDDQKADLIKTVWMIAESFIDRSFKCDSTQIALDKAQADSIAKAGDSLSLQTPKNQNNNTHGGPKP